LESGLDAPPFPSHQKSKNMTVLKIPKNLMGQDDCFTFAFGVQKINRAMMQFKVFNST